jgi:uracil-DNA glycosylase family 4
MGFAPAQPPRDISAYGRPEDHGAKCSLCPLQGSPFVPYEGPAEGKKVRLAICGEGPGRGELARLRPFVGQTGQMLDQEIEAVGLDRSQMHVSNATLCLGFNDKDNERAAECCAPRLLKELAALPADVPILTMGKAASKSVLGVKSVLLARGFVWTARDLSTSIDTAEAAVRKAIRDSSKSREARIKKRPALVEARLKLETLEQRNKLAGRVVFPTLHPTFAFIHNETWAPIFRIDIDRCARFVRHEFRLEDLADRIERVKTLEEFASRKRVFVVTDNKNEILKAGKVLADDVSIDIETEAVHPLSPLLVKILCVQIGDRNKRALVIGPWDARRHAKALTKLLATKHGVIVTHNGFNFDHPALERPGEDILIPAPRVEDTLVAHHAFASQYPQRLDHVVSTFLDSGPWKIKFGRRGGTEKGLPPQNMDPDELYHYGAVDPILTALAWDAMQADLEPERKVYEHDKQLGVQGKLLQTVGIKVDVERKDFLSKALAKRAAYLKGHMRTLARRPNFAPSKLGQVRRVLFNTLKAPMLNPTATGLASTSNATLEVIRTGGAATLRPGPADVKKTSGAIIHDTKQTKAGMFAEALLNWRVVCKIKSTYCDAIQVHDDGRAHYNWRAYGTVSGRYSSRIQSCPRWSKKLEDRVREIYTASPGCLLVYFDLSQAEMRMAAALSGDAVFMKTCEGDVHTGNAKILFPDAAEMLTRDPKGAFCPEHADGARGGTCNCGKPFRDIAKNAGFAVSYLAEAPTVFAYLRSHGFPVEADAVDDMLMRLKASYSRYYEYVGENVRFVEKNGYLRTAVMGRIRWFGFHPKPTEIANFGVQAGIADAINLGSLYLQSVFSPDIRLIANVHDALIWDVPNKYISWATNAKGKQVPRGPVVEEIERLWAKPIHLPQGIICREARDVLLPCEVKVGDRWSVFG